MSRFVRASQIAALALVTSAALAGPALADASPIQAADPCGQWTARSGIAACRAARRHAVADARRLPSYPEARQTYAGPRYVSLLILGVGF